MFQKTINSLKNTNFVENYRRMYPYIYPYRYKAILAILLTIPVGSMDAIIASLLNPFMDTVMIEKSTQEAMMVPLFIIGFSFIQSTLNYASTYLNAWVGNKITMDLKSKVFSTIMHNEPGFFDSITSGDLQFRCNTDVDLACSGLINNLRIFATRLFSSIALIGVLFWNSWQLALIAIFVLGIAMYPLSQLRKKISGITAKSVFSGARIMTHFNETFAGNRVVTSYNLYGKQSTRFRETLDSVFMLGMKMVRRTGILSPLMHFIISFGIAGVIWLGSYLIISNQLTPGQFVSFIAALLMLYTPLKGMGNTFASVQLSFMAIERVFELLNKEPKIVNLSDAKPLEKIVNTITYENVYFEYQKNKPVLNHINLEIPVGKKVAFVGNSGGGKTTLVNLLPRFYEVTEGAILIDGVNIKEFDLYSLRENIAIVFQDNFLFAGTIRENILLGRTDLSEDEIHHILQNSCLDEFIDSLEHGLDTEIGERGILLSGGQKQRLAIARAFIKNSPIVILDEATSALDNKSEAIVQKAIDNLMKDRTVLIIAHRLSTIKNADKIVVVNYGDIVETGTHAELINKEDSLYKSLYQTSLA